MSFKTNSETDQDIPVPCATPSCSFWGRPSTNNYCSQCHKEKLTSEEQNRESDKAEAQISKALSASISSNTLKDSIPQFTDSDILLNPQTKSNKNDYTLSTLLEVPEIPHTDSFSLPSPIVSSEVVFHADKKRSVSVYPTNNSQETIKDNTEVENEKVQTDTRRCLECNKFVGFAGIKCKCENVFCAPHRYPEKHNCEFNFEKAAREKFLKNRNEAAVADKFGNGERL